MAENALKEQLAARLEELDARFITPPIEIVVGEYSFYPYHGFSDILSRADFKKLTQGQLKILVKIADDILAMRRTQLFEAFVNDDGIVVVDKQQPHIEYSIDIEYNGARSRIEEIYPQVNYPVNIKATRVQDAFVRNDTAHEVTHHADFWVDQQANTSRLQYLHSTSTLLAWLEELDLDLRPNGVADLFIKVRNAEGYVAERLLEEGYKPAKVDQMLRAEFFAIAGEYYFGSEQTFKARSPLLEAYMEYVLETDLDIQNLYIPFQEMEARRKILREAIHAPVDRLLREHANPFHELRRQLEAEQVNARRARIGREMEKLVIRAVKEMIDNVRSRAKLPPRRAMRKPKSNDSPMAEARP